MADSILSTSEDDDDRDEAGPANEDEQTDAGRHTQPGVSFFPTSLANSYTTLHMEYCIV